MFTRRTAIKIATEYVQNLKRHGYNPQKAILFGSYAKGNPRKDSDIDLAIWDRNFTGCLPQDIETLVFAHKIKTPPLLELHTFHTDENEETNPFIAEILKYGIIIGTS